MCIHMHMCIFVYKYAFIFIHIHILSPSRACSLALTLFLSPAPLSHTDTRANLGNMGVVHVAASWAWNLDCREDVERLLARLPRM